MTSAFNVRDVGKNDITAVGLTSGTRQANSTPAGTSNGEQPQISEATASRPMIRASARTSCFWSSRSLDSNGWAAALICSIIAADESVLARCRTPLMDFPSDIAQRVFHGRPVGLLSARQLQPSFQRSDLHIAKQRIILLKGWFASFGRGRGSGGSSTGWRDGKISVSSGNSVATACRSDSGNVEIAARVRRRGLHRKPVGFAVAIASRRF